MISVLVVLNDFTSTNLLITAAGKNSVIILSARAIHECCLHDIMTYHIPY